MYLSVAAASGDRFIPRIVLPPELPRPKTVPPLSTTLDLPHSIRISSLSTHAHAQAQAEAQATSKPRGEDQAVDPDEKHNRLPSHSNDTDTKTHGVPYRLVIYQKYLVTLFLLLEDSSDGKSVAPCPAESFYDDLERFVSSNFRKLSEALERQTRLTSSGASQRQAFRFLYFNHMNLALKPSLNTKNSPLTMEAINLIRNIHNDFSRAWESGDGKETGPTEICVKTRTNGWVVGRRGTQSHREFFVLLDESVGNLADTKEQIDRLARTSFSNIYIH